MITITRALEQLKDIEMMGSKDAEFIGEMRRKAAELWTFDDVKRVQNLWNQFIRE